jgi:hypothetical protein
MARDSARARAAYQDFLTLWKDADPDIPILKQAKAEYAKLQQFVENLWRKSLHIPICREVPRAKINSVITAFTRADHLNCHFQGCFRVGDYYRPISCFTLPKKSVCEAD